MSESDRASFAAYDVEFVVEISPSTSLYICIALSRAADACVRVIVELVQERRASKALGPPVRAVHRHILRPLGIESNMRRAAIALTAALLALMRERRRRLRLRLLLEGASHRIQPSAWALAGGIGWLYGIGCVLGPFYGVGVGLTFPGGILAGAGGGVGVVVGIGMGGGLVWGAGRGSVRGLGVPSSSGDVSSPLLLAGNDG
ncbi:hypothetical protein EMIHUDRAFT_202923 [Emiliania huxleyi CCMP1516]|uniref:Uncharacterized protein n=2 Tax=Emiliania huxleyi TaxID=2903 RepID=A0A0D3K918_EMIH1|nr:hypothetical protein EMIHUDRAFT_202923 [Emiliania huxleyi CCMP1516]EOD32253.1 hypothetical protein EMIHUDRAFT_202923 [Emiliania huxleyi CCMP1516]|eukprot:XP_005784682.1 hypothetical protein EMIHUDRAFT_202923 [Emiliania huxleyi CCMP1516]